MTAQEISDLELAILTALVVRGRYDDGEFELTRLPRAETHRIRLTHKGQTLPLAEADIVSVRGMINTYLFHFRKVRVDEPAAPPTRTDDTLSPIDLAMKMDAFGTVFPGDFDPKGDPTRPPDWWLVARDHYEAELRALERVCDELLVLLEAPEPDVFRIRDTHDEAWKRLGSVHGILGKLPIGVLKMPDVLGRKWNRACGGAMFLIEGELKKAKRAAAPIPMLLHCPACHAQHVDAPDPANGWDNPPHRSHLCPCGCVWRPADVFTTGVAAIETRGERDTWRSS